MVTNFTWRILIVGLVVGVLVAVCYFFIEKDEEEKRRNAYLDKMRNK